MLTFMGWQRVRHNLATEQQKPISRDSQPGRQLYYSLYYYYSIFIILFIGAFQKTINPSIGIISSLHPKTLYPIASKVVPFLASLLFPFRVRSAKEKEDLKPSRTLRGPRDSSRVEAGPQCSSPFLSQIARSLHVSTGESGLVFSGGWDSSCLSSCSRGDRPLVELCV